MSKRVYNKTPLSFADQMYLLERRGLTISVPIQFVRIPSYGKGNMLNWKNENLWK